jgi:hypothetical protein
MATIVFKVALIFPSLTLAAARFGDVALRALAPAFDAAFDALRFGDIAKPLDLVLESI